MTSEPKAVRSLRAEVKQLRAELTGDLLPLPEVRVPAGRALVLNPTGWEIRSAVLGPIAAGEVLEVSEDDAVRATSIGVFCH
jgi:hypothetical protein